MRRSAKRLSAKLRNFFNPVRAEAELTREIESHLTLLADHFCQQGLEPEEARLAARRAYGGVEQTKELHREERSVIWLEQTRQDLQFALRTLWKSPGFTITSVGVLALGLGATSAILTLLQHTILKPLPYRDPSRLVRLIENIPAAESFTGKAVRLPALSVEDARELSRKSKALADVAFYLPGSMVLTEPRGAQVVSVTQIPPAMLPLLGRQPFLGRAFRAEESTAGADHLVLLSYQAWVRYFGADSHVLEQRVRLDDVSYAVVGVMPPDFAFPDSKTAFWKPLVPATVNTGQLMVFPVLARIASAFSLATASAEVNKVFARMRGDTLTAGQGSGLPRIEIQKMQDAQSTVSRPALLVLAGAVFFVLLIAYANVWNLLLARSINRQQEMATRATLGASWGRLFCQCSTESLLLASLGGLVSIPVTITMNHGLSANWPGNVDLTGAVPKLESLGVDPLVLLFTSGLVILTGLVLGMASVLHLPRTDQMELIKGGIARASSGLLTRRGPTGLGALVMLETGLAFMLLIGAGLLLRSFLRLSSVDPGFSIKNVLTFQVASPPSGARTVFNADLAERLRALPGVQTAGYGELLPLELDSMLIRPLHVDSTVARTRTEVIQPRTLEGSWNYFPAVGFRLLQGRWFQESDGPGQHQVMLVNQAFARYYFGDQDPLGKTVTSLGSAPWKIVGVIKDVRQQGLPSRPEPQFFLEYRQMQHANPGWNTGLDRIYSHHLYFAVRTTSKPPEMLIPSIRKIIEQLDQKAVMDNTASLEDVVAHTIAAPAFFSALVGAFSAVALGLAALGLYGVMAYAVAQRTREIGIRMALGSNRTQVLRLVLGQGARLAASGILFGLVGSLLLTHSLQGLLFGVTPLDWPTFVIVSALFLIVVIAASYIPAHRAIQVDPALSLREE